MVFEWVKCDVWKDIWLWFDGKIFLSFCNTQAQEFSVKTAHFFSETSNFKHFLETTINNLFFTQHPNWRIFRENNQFSFFPANAANPISRIFSENNEPTYKWFLWIRSKPDQWSLNSFMWIIHVYLFYVWNVEYWQIFLLYFHGFFSALVKIGSDTLMKMICIVGMISTKKIQTHLWQFCWGSDSAPMNNASHSRFVDVSWDDVTGELCLRFSSGPWGWILDKY